MTDTLDVDPAIPFMADIMYKHLVAPTRAKDVGLKFYRRELKKQRATESDLRLVSTIAARYFIEKYDALKESENSDPSDEERSNLVKESISYAIEQYKHK